MPERFVIPLSVIGRTENISSEAVRAAAVKLESAGEIEIQRTPTGRGLLNIPGYRRLQREILLPNSPQQAA